MSVITLEGHPVHTVGDLPPVGSALPDFEVVTSDLADLSSASLIGQRTVFSFFPSVDTGVCAASVRRFNEAAAATGARIVCVSADLPFALTRFCAAEGIDAVTAASSFRSTLGQTLGLTMADGPLRGLLSRAIVVVDENGRIVYTEQVREIRDEPDYDAALAALR